MKMSKAVILFLVAGLLIGCESDDKDDLASISGIVSLSGNLPAEGDIQISLFANWDASESMSIAPGGPPSYATDPLISSTPDSDSHEIAWTIENITPGTYNSLVVGWRNGGELGLDEPVLGMHGGDFAIGDTLPEALTLSAGDDLQFDFAGDLSLIQSEGTPTAGTVSGEVNFSADWPTGYDDVLIVLMSSDNPSVPSQPVSMQTLTAEANDFELATPVGQDYYLAVYGFPYNFADPYQDFYGGYGWDWNSMDFTLSPVQLIDETSFLTGLEIQCRNQE
jgi:hypothetical protein